LKKLLLFILIPFLFIFIQADNIQKVTKNILNDVSKIKTISISVNGYFTMGILYDMTSWNLNPHHYIHYHFTIISEKFKYKVVSATLNHNTLKKENVNSFKGTLDRFKPGKELTLRLGIKAKEGKKPVIITIATLINPNFITNITSPNSGEIINILPSNKLKLSWRFSREIPNSSVFLQQYPPSKMIFSNKNISTNHLVVETTALDNNKEFQLFVSNESVSTDRFRFSKYVKRGSSILTLRTHLSFSFKTMNNKIHISNF